MKKSKQHRSPLMASIHETVEGLKAAGLMDMSKKLPVFKTDKEADKFLDQDLTDYISAENFAAFQFAHRRKQKSVNLPPSGKGRTRSSGK